MVQCLGENNVTSKIEEEPEAAIILLELTNALETLKRELEKVEITEKELYDKTSSKYSDANQQLIRCNAKNNHESAQSEITEFNTHQHIDSTFANDVQKLIKRRVLGTNLPKFSGDVAEWPSFLITYRRTSSECQFSNRENVQRLQDCLEGAARKCVCRTLATGDAERVILVLKEHYGNAEVILKQLHSDIAALTTSKSFRVFSNLVETFTGIIKSFEEGADTHVQKSILKSLINNLPNCLRTQWTDYVNKKNIHLPNFKTFLDWFNNQINHNSLVAHGDPDTQRKRKEREQLVQIKVFRNQPNSFGDLMKNGHCRMCYLNQHGLLHCGEFIKAKVNTMWDMANRTHSCYCCISKHCGMIQSCTKRYQEPKKSATMVTQEKSILKMMLVQIRGPKATVNAIAFIDHSSNVTLLDSGLAAEIGLIGERTLICCKWAAGISKNVSAKISKNFESHPVYTITNIRTMDDLELSLQHINTTEIFKQFPFVHHTDPAGVCSVRSFILIGRDNCALIVSEDIIHVEVQYFQRLK
jgi:hypothetical protein